MILVNQQELPLNNVDKNHPLFGYAKEYKRDLEALRERFPKGIVRLRRKGFPKQNPTGMLEPTPHMVIPAQCNVEGENGQALWAYCEGRATIHPNGMRDLPDSKKHIHVAELLTIDLNKQPDKAVYLFKTKFIGKELIIDDPEGQAIKEALQRQNEIELASAIWTGIASEPKLRMIAAAWGVPNSGTTDIVVLKKQLEDRVNQLEKEKKQNEHDLSRKGISEFLNEIKADGDMRLRGMIQLAIDDKVLEFVKETGNMRFKGQKYLAIPMEYQKGRIAEYMTSYLSHPTNEEQLVSFLTNLLTAEMIEDMDTKGLVWLCKVYGIDTKDKAPSLLKEEIKGKTGK